MEVTSPNKERVIMNFQEFIAKDDQPVKSMDDVVGAEGETDEPTPVTPEEPTVSIENVEDQETPAEPVSTEEPETK